MSGRQASSTVTRYAGIQVQTSALGLQISLGWGTFRAKCNLLDYVGFYSRAQTASTGKGGGSTTTGYSYNATIILGICEGPIDGINQIWVDSTIYTDGGAQVSSQGVSPIAPANYTGSDTALSQAGLSLNKGAIGQAVWSYMTSNYPTHAIGYSGIAIVYAANYALDSSATPPNHSFQVVRTTGFGPILSPSGAYDIDPSLMLADFFQNPRTGVPLWPASGLIGAYNLGQYQDYCLAAGLLLSPLIDQERSAADFINEVLLGTNSTCVWSEGVLKFIPYGDANLTGNGKTYTAPNTPIYSLDDDDFLQDGRGKPVLQVDIEDQSDAYNLVQIEYLDRTNQYNMAIALASDAANVEQYGARRKDPDTCHVVCDPTVASQVAQLWLQRTLYIRSQYKFKLGWMFALLEPGDIIEISDPGLELTNYPVRVIQIDQDEKYGLNFICEDYPIGVANSPLYEMQSGSGFMTDQAADPGGVEANLLIYSDSPANAAWTKTNATITADSTTDQYGLTLASTLVPAVVSGAHGISQTVANAFAGSNYTFAACVEAGTHSLVALRVTDGGSNSATLLANISTGAVVSAVEAGTTCTVVASSVVPTLVSGIWQVILVVNFSALSAGIVCSVLSADASGNISWTGDVSNALYVSQLQLREGVAIGTYAATGATADGPVLFNPPSALASASQVWAAVAGGPNWGGCNVWTSIDGTNYQQVGTIAAASRYGSATTSFASASDPDTTDNLGVDLGPSAGDLTSASQATADNGGTLCLIDGELICFEVATLTNPSRYTLGTYIRRGFLNTPIASHSAGAPFVRLDGNPFQFPYFAVSVGQTVYVKFQSFNHFAKAMDELADCIAYSCVPSPTPSAAPGSGAWTATAVSLANGGQSVPAIQITGASDNPSATAIEFDYRVTGAAAWTSSGTASNAATSRLITAVAPNTSYDVSVLYLVGGVPSNREIVATGLSLGAINTGSTPSGTVLVNDSTPGSRTVALPAGSYTHVDVELWGPGGDGSSLTTSYPVNLTTYSGGGGGENRALTNIAVTPGSTTITYDIAAGGSAAASTVSATGPWTAMTAGPGANASGSTSGAGGSGGSGGTGTNGSAGASGSYPGAPATGGGAGNGGGNVSGTNAAGSSPGGGAAGSGPLSLGAAGCITIKVH